MSDKIVQDKNKQLIDKIKTQFDGSSDYHSGVNDGLYSILNHVHEISDGYHTMDELYEHRIRLFIELCKALKEVERLDAYNTSNISKRPIWAYVPNPSDQWFLLGIGKDNGEQITYHLPARFWNEVCEFAEVLKKQPEWDGHNPPDVLKRLKQL